MITYHEASTEIAIPQNKTKQKTQPTSTISYNRNYMDAKTIRISFFFCSFINFAQKLHRCQFLERRAQVSKVRRIFTKEDENAKFSSLYVGGELFRCFYGAAAAGHQH